jgi:hypothetical protein
MRGTLFRINQRCDLLSTEWTVFFCNLDTWGVDGTTTKGLMEFFGVLDVPIPEDGLN